MEVGGPPNYPKIEETHRVVLLMAVISYGERTESKIGKGKRWWGGTRYASHTGVTQAVTNSPNSGL